MNPRITTVLLFALMLSPAVTCTRCSAEAAEPTMTPELVCTVKSALRKPMWSPATCAIVARALNDTAAPEKFLAIAVLESDLRARAMRVTELAGGLRAYDIGLTGIRCVVDPASTDPDLCLNGVAKGLRARQLFDPGVSFRTAEAVLRSHGGSLDRYNGCRETRHRKCRYAEHVAALAAAFGGVEVRVKSARVRTLVRKIVEAVKGEPKS